MTHKLGAEAPQQKHFSASELAGLPGLPTTERRVLEWAKRQQWPSRPRAKRGGGREYPISCLPALTQAALAEKVVPPTAIAHLRFAHALLWLALGAVLGAALATITLVVLGRAT